MTKSIKIKLKIIRIKSQYPLRLRSNKWHIGYIGTTCLCAPEKNVSLVHKDKWLAIIWRIK